eukprot:1194974-Prorocentrum_minimum.AAC.4
MRGTNAQNASYQRCEHPGFLGASSGSGEGQEGVRRGSGGGLLLSFGTERFMVTEGGHSRPNPKHCRPSSCSNSSSSPLISSPADPSTGPRSPTQESTNLD